LIDWVLGSMTFWITQPGSLAIPLLASALIITVLDPRLESNHQQNHLDLAIKYIGLHVNHKG
jgi:hypothetical protein